jgi:hypothetical protein
MTIYYLTFKTPDGNVTDANVTANTVHEAMAVLQMEEKEAVIVSVVDTETNLETVIDHFNFYKGRPLQDWYHIEIETRQLPEEQQHFELGTSIWVTTSKQVFFCSRIHVEKRIKIGADSYSGLFTTNELMNCNYVSTSICQKIGGDIWA